MEHLDDITVREWTQHELASLEKHTMLNPWLEKGAWRYRDSLAWFETDEEREVFVLETDYYGKWLFQYRDEAEQWIDDFDDTGTEYRLYAEIMTGRDYGDLPQIEDV